LKSSGKKPYVNIYKRYFSEGLAHSHDINIAKSTIFSPFAFTNPLYIVFLIDFCNYIMYTDSTSLITMYTVIKRDGRSTEFNLTRISHAITKAFDATGIPYSPDVINLLSLQVTADFAPKVKDDTIDVESIQDSVEKTLQRAGYDKVAKAYILYRKNREKLRNMSSTILDYKGLVDGYLKVSDWRVKENSTVTYSVGGLILSNSGAITANYWLSEIYDEEIADAHRNADLHLHDLSMLTGYCAGWSLL